MNKIMIYHRKSLLNKENILSVIKDKSTVFLLFITYVCGLIISCSCYNSFTAVIIGDSLSLFAQNTKFYLINGSLFYISMLLMAFTGGLSCFGTFFQVLVNLISGVCNGSILLLFLDSMSYTGILSALKTVLISAVIIGTLIIIQGEYSIKLSNIVAGNIILNRGDTVEVKPYIIMTLLFLAAGLAVILVNSLTNMIFN